MRYLILFTIATSVLMAGCFGGSEKFDPRIPERTELTMTEPYVLNTESLDNQFSVTLENILSDVDIDYRDYETVIILSEDQFSKIADLVEITEGYKDIAYAQETLVNVHIDTINALNNIIALKDRELELYIDMWVNAENLYREESKLHRRSNILNTIKLYGSNALWIVATVL